MTILTSTIFQIFFQAFLEGIASVATWLTSAWAQPADLPSMIPVRSGDTFSSIAARYAGNPVSWRQLYNSKLSSLKTPNWPSVGMQLELVTDQPAGRHLRLVSTARSSAENVGTAARSVATIPLRAKSPASIAAPTVSTAGTTSKDETFTVGVVPNIIVTALQTQYENRNRYLDRVGNKQKVRIEVPANFKAFFDRSMLGDYDLAIAAPNLARAAQLDRNLTLLVSDKPRIAANMVTLSTGGIVNPRAIQGKPLAFANSQSSLAMYGQQWLSANLQLEAGRDYEVKAARTDLDAGRTVLAGEAAAAIMGQGEYVLYQRMKQRAYECSELLPGLQTLFFLPILGWGAIKRLVCERY